MSTINSATNNLRKQVLLNNTFLLMTNHKTINLTRPINSTRPIKLVMNPV